MAENLLRHAEPPAGRAADDDASVAPDDAPPPRRCCFCLAPRAAATLACLLAAISNILSIAVCIVLFLDDNLHDYFYDERFNCVFIATINTVMLISNFLVLRGVWLQQQKYIMAWIILYLALVFLENVVGVAAFILAMVAHASAWCAVPFSLMIILDGLYIYSIIIIHRYYKSLEEYSVFP